MIKSTAEERCRIGSRNDRQASGIMLEDCNLDAVAIHESRRGKQQ